MSPSIPFNSRFMSLSFSRYVRFIFHVCPFLSLPVISLHLPSCPLVSLSFVCLAVPPHSPCFHFFPLHVPFSPLHVPFRPPSFPFHFPWLSCHVNFLSPACPCISLYFLPSCPSTFPSLPVFFPKSNLTKNTFFSYVFANQYVTNTELFQIFGKRRIRVWDPCFATPAPRILCIVEHHQISARYVGHPPPPPVSDVARGRG